MNTELKKLKSVLPNRYYEGLSKGDQIKQLKQLKASRDAYKKGIYLTRKKMKSFKNKKSGHVQNFEKKYKVSITDIPAVSKATGVPEEAIYRIISKGMGAFYSGGSRPNQNPWSWAYARVASVLTGGPSYKIDKHILDDYGIKKKFTARGGGRPKVIMCHDKKLTDETVKSYKSCMRKSDKKVFPLPRKFSIKKCREAKRPISSFTKRASCAPFKK